MTKDEAREYIVNHPTDYLKPDRSGKGYVCPICKSGTGNKGTGITTQDGVHFTCWAGCFQSADLLDIIGQEYGLTEYRDKLTCAADLLNISIDGEEQPRTTYVKKPAPAKKEPHNQEEPEQDYTQFYRDANQNLEKTDYHRGLSLRTLNHFMCGYVAEWKHPKCPKDPPTPRLIVPTSRNSYLARETRSQVQPTEKPTPQKSKVGAVHIFNLKALERAEQPIFIVEGEIDAMSIYEVGGEAVGLGSASNVRILLEEMEKKKPQIPFIIIPDNDGPGGKATAKLTAGLDKLQIRYRVAPLKMYKDANEALMQRKRDLRDFVETNKRELEEEEKAATEREKEAYKEESAAYALASFVQDIENSATATCIPTGFSCIDEQIDGGFFPGLYVIGAISSLGKTTFCLQVVDQVAAAGHDVLIFSLEMARNELIAKSVSRETLLLDLEQNSSTRNAKTTRGILTGSRYGNYSSKERSLIAEAVNKYGDYAENIHITVGVGDIGVNKIREKVEKHISLTGKRPLVLIDYLQILAPYDLHFTDKQNTDKAVLELKRISRDYDIPVFAISSFNRDSYTEPVSMASFKESGAVEYSSDVLFGLQYDGMDRRDREKESDRASRVRNMFKENETNAKAGEAIPIQVKILKNRNGSKGNATLEFFPKFNYFRETDGKATAAPTQPSWANWATGNKEG